MGLSSSSSSGSLAFRALLLGVASFLGAELGHWLSFEGSPFATFWPPSGILFSALVLNDYRRWPLLGSVCLLAMVLSETQLHQQTLGISLGYGLANLIAGCLAALALRAMYPKGFAFDSLSHVVSFLVSGVLIGSTVSAILGAEIVATSFAAHPFETTAITWWSSVMLGTIVFGSLIIAWKTDKQPALGNLGIQQWVLLLAVAVALFWGFCSVGRTRFALAFPLLYLPAPAYAAIVFSRKSALVMVLFVVVTAIYRTTHDCSVISQLFTSTHDRALALQFFGGITAISALVVSTIVEERRQAQEESREHQRLLESRVAERTQLLEQATSELLEKRHLLAHASRISTAGEFAAGIAHELNQPLYAIHNYVNGLKRCVDKGLTHVDVQDVLADLRSEAERASAIIKRLRHFVDRKSCKVEEVSLRDVVADALQLSRHELLKREIEVAVDLPSTIPVVLGDAIQLQQVLVNVLRNAAESLELVPPKGRRLSIRVVLQGGQLRTMIQDNGAGFAPDYKDRLFDAFYTTKADGMGMGLAISRSIIEAHGGVLTAYPCLPSGATFEFTLPLPPAREPAERDTRQPKVATLIKPRRAAEVVAR